MASPISDFQPSLSNYPISKIEHDLDSLNETFESLGKLEAGKPIVYTKGGGESVGTFKSRGDAIQSKTHEAGGSIIGKTKSLISQTTHSVRGTIETDDPMMAARDVETQVNSLHDKLLDPKVKLNPDQLEHCLATLNTLRKRLPKALKGFDILSELNLAATGKNQAVIYATYKNISNGIVKQINDMETVLRESLRKKQIKKIPKETITEAEESITKVHGKRKEEFISVNERRGSTKDKVAQARNARKEALEIFARRRGVVEGVSNKIAAKHKEMLLRTKYDVVIEEIQTKKPTLKHIEPPVEKPIKFEEEKEPEDKSAEAPTPPSPPPAAPPGAPPPPLPPPPMGAKKPPEELYTERRIMSRFGDTDSFYTLSKEAAQKINTKDHDIETHSGFLKSLNGLPPSEAKEKLIEDEKEKIGTLESDKKEIEINGKVGIDLASAKQKFSKYFNDELYMIVGVYYTGEPQALMAKKERLEELRASLQTKIDTEALDSEEKEKVERQHRAIKSEMSALDDAIRLIEEAVWQYEAKVSPEKKAIFEKAKKQWGQVLKLSGNMITAVLTVLRDRITGGAEEPPPDVKPTSGGGAKESSLKKAQRDEREAASKRVTANDLLAGREAVLKKKFKEKSKPA